MTKPQSNLNGLNSKHDCHCEERSDEAIPLIGSAS